MIQAKSKYHRFLTGLPVLGNWAESYFKTMRPIKSLSPEDLADSKDGPIAQDCGTQQPLMFKLAEAQILAYPISLNDNRRS